MKNVLQGLPDRLSMEGTSGLRIRYGNTIQCWKWTPISLQNHCGLLPLRCDIYSFIYLKTVNIWASLRALCSVPGPIPRLVKSYLGMRRPRVCLLTKQAENVVLLICSVQLMVEGLYVLSILEEEDARKEALLEKFTKVVVDNSDHLQPGWERYNTTTMDRRQVVCLVVASFSLSLSL